MSKFDPSLTEQDIELIRKLMMHCDAHHLEDFSSDDFREAGLDNLCNLQECKHPLWKNCSSANGERCEFAVMQDPAHDIGTFFAKLKWNQIAEPVSEIPSGIESNNARRVDVWRWNWHRWRVIVHGRMEAYL